MPVAITRDGAHALGERARRDLGRRVERALGRARARGGEVLAAVTVDAATDTDPSAVAAASRRQGERWFCFEQPARDRAALAALGSAWSVQASGPGRFATVAAAWREAAAAAASDPPPGDGAGLVAVGGFAFAPDGGATSEWAGFAPAQMTVPEVALHRSGDRVTITLAVAVAPDDTAQDAMARAEGRLAELRAVPLPMLDPAPSGRHRIAGEAPPEHYEDAVARAVERIRAGELEKIVLARAVDVDAPTAHDPAAVLGILRAEFPECYVYCASSGEAAFIGASPELLVRREGQRASTVALAGSTRRSADPAVDDHLGEQLMHSAKDRSEQAIVARRIERTLRDRAVWVTAAPDPVLVKVANIQHLATPIRAQLAEPVGALDLAGLLHPTPAVGGEPLAVAAPLIPALEGLDRGWYAGPVGWSDAAEDGEFCVALRCALLRGTRARCYAGVGVVADSDPAAELAETEIKLQALLPAVSG